MIGSSKLNNKSEHEFEPQSVCVCVNEIEWDIGRERDGEKCNFIVWIEYKVKVLVG